MGTSNIISLAGLIVSIIALLIAAIVDHERIGKLLINLKNKVFPEGKVNKSRRKAIISIVTVLTASIISPYAYKLFVKARQKCENIIKRIIGNEFVVNKVTGTIHHRRICSDHLPKDDNQEALSKYEACPRIHKTKLIEITRELSKSKAMDDNDKVAILIETIKKLGVDRIRIFHPL